MPAYLLLIAAIRLIAFPIGKLAAIVLPYRTRRLPAFLGGYSYSLNPGPFNMKVCLFDGLRRVPYSTMQEHACIYMMANTAVFPTYALNTIVVIEYVTCYTSSLPKLNSASQMVL